MAHVIRDTRYIERDDQAFHSFAEPMSFVGRLAYFIAGIINSLLVLRFVLVLFGANPVNIFANFIYSITQPLVAPFFGLFNYRAAYGVVRFEFEALIAIVVYTVLAWAVASFMNFLTRRDAE